MTTSTTGTPTWYKALSTQGLIAASFGSSLLILLGCHGVSASEDDVQSSSLSFWERVRGGPSKLEPLDQIFFGVLVLLALELVNFTAKNFGYWFGTRQIPVRGKHLDDFSMTDLIFIGISKAQTAPFTYLYLRYGYYEPNIEWDLSKISILNTLVALPLLFIVYDFFYTIFHWALHIKAIYGWVHKHHHHQKAPSRANVDAINVHPFEFVVGEYNHLFALFLIARWMDFPVHVVTTVAFLAVGGFAAGVNHTRFDVEIKILGCVIYDSKVHDVHHRIPQSNYGQYTMFWDYVFGTFRRYDPNDRVNPEAQLDPQTGKTLTNGKKKST